MAAATTIELTFVSEDIKNKFEEEFNKFMADTALMEKVDAVDTIEEIYEICKEKVQFTLDQYRKIMRDVESHIKSKFIDNQDEELSDDDLEDVVGGSWKSFWKKVGKVAAIVGIVVGTVALGVATGGIAAAGVATGALAAIGAAGTAGAGAAIAAGTTTIAVAGITGGVAGGAMAGATMAGL